VALAAWLSLHWVALAQNCFVGSFSQTPPVRPQTRTDHTSESYPAIGAPLAANHLGDMGQIGACGWLGVFAGAAISNCVHIMAIRRVHLGLWKSALENCAEV
jgi:hypothetical protein